MLRERSFRDGVTGNSSIRTVRYFTGPMPSHVSLKKKFLLANVPYKIVGGVNFYARKEIKDLLSYLKTIDNASDDLAVRRILNVPKRGIGATSIGRVQDYADMMNLSFYDALRVVEEVPSIGRAAGKINDFVSFIQGLKSKAEAYTVRETLEEVIELTGYVKELEAEKQKKLRQGSRISMS